MSSTNKVPMISLDADVGTDLKDDSKKDTLTSIKRASVVKSSIGSLKPVLEETPTAAQFVSASGGQVLQNHRQRVGRTTN